ncbi:MAG: cobalamin-dependent protein [Acidobacteriota bacterium]
MSSSSRYHAECLLLHAGVATIATGLPSICRYLRNAGVAAEILRIAPSVVETLADDIARFTNLRLIGISMHWHPQVPISIKLAELLRALPGSRHAAIVIGGMTASYFAEELIRLPFVDFVIKGDGELPMLLLFRSLCGSVVPLSSVPNLYFKRNGEVVRSRETYCIDEETLASLERQVIDDGEWFPQTRSVLSVGRGCDYDCIACGGNRRGLPRWGNRIAAMRRDPGSIRVSIEKLLSQDAGRLFLLNDYDGRFEMLGTCLQEFDLSAFKTLAVDAWGLPRFENLQRALAGTRPGGDLVVTLELSPEAGNEETRARVRSCSYSNADLTELMDRVFSHYRNIRIVLCFTYFLPFSDKYNLETRSFIRSLTTTYLQQILENRLQIQFWPLSTDPGSSIQQDMVEGLRHDVHALADYLGKMLAMRSTGGNLLRHWPAEMEPGEIDYLCRFFTYENVLRLLYPVLYLNLVQLFDEFSGYDQFVRSSFEPFYDIHLRNSSSSAMHALHVSLDSSSIFGFAFSGDEALPKLPLVLVWLRFLERGLRKHAGESLPARASRRSQACLCPDLVSPLSTKGDDFASFSGAENVSMEWTDLHSYVLELLDLIARREAFRLGQAGRKKPLFLDFLLYNDRKVDAIIERGLFRCELLPAANVLCEIIPIRRAHVIIPPLTSHENLRLLGARLFEKLICGADYRDGSASWQRELRAELSAEGDLREVVEGRVEELWRTVLRDEQSDLGRVLTDLIISSHVPSNQILARMGISQDDEALRAAATSGSSTLRLRLRDLYGVFGDRCDIRLAAFYLNHTKSTCRFREVVRPGSEEVAILTTIYYPDPCGHDGAFVFSAGLDPIELEALRLCDGTHTMNEILSRLDERFPESRLSGPRLGDMMISFYSRQLVY